ncbi:hypothetical protein BGW36DRAFT_362896 [Talaromyces proteolyticus]|uniref:Uncharacterized protein n=1 Tax=Talaromyces proteolyticus TaxID=1131652 RepID=A0AAD4KN64_9EURO|nr:uncharacterized protein BGW36DRAFT_362896 [Talaromyces proteolyticus]KAH8691865.1 hypothetical protein BGW36DRAFT_362896 [Talaromyces proteolyticus]
MTYPCITLHIQENVSFSWENDYSNVASSDLEGLLLQSRHAVTSLEAELERRQLRRGLGGLSRVDDCWIRLQKQARQIQIRGRLDDKGKKQAKIAVGSLNGVTEKSANFYREFLQDVLHDCGSEFVILCAAALGKHRVVNLKKDDRISLLGRIKTEMQTIKVSALSVIAKDYQMPSGQAGYSRSAFLPLDEMGANVILEATRKDRNLLGIALPDAHETLPYIVIPHQICANIMRLYTS